MLVVIGAERGSCFGMDVKAAVTRGEAPSIYARRNYIKLGVHEVAYPLEYLEEAHSALINGLAGASQMCSSLAKYLFANGWHECSKLVTNITSDIASTVFSYREWMNPKERPYLEKYVAGKVGVSTRDRLKTVRLVRDPEVQSVLRGKSEELGLRDALLIGKL